MTPESLICLFMIMSNPEETSVLKWKSYHRCHQSLLSKREGIDGGGGVSGCHSISHLSFSVPLIQFVEPPIHVSTFTLEQERSSLHSTPPLAFTHCHTWRKAGICEDKWQWQRLLMNPCLCSFQGKEKHNGVPQKSACYDAA